MAALITFVVDKKWFCLTIVDTGWPHTVYPESDAPHVVDFVYKVWFAMAGKVKFLIDQLIELRTKGDRGLIAPLKIKLIMKGVDPDMFDDSSPDNPMIIQRLMNIAKDMGYDLQ